MGAQGEFSLRGSIEATSSSRRGNCVGRKRTGVEGGGRAAQEEKTASAKALGTDGAWCVQRHEEAGVVGEVLRDGLVYSIPS